MQQEFLNIPEDTWNVIFLVVRYVAVALILAYLSNVYVKRKNIRTDIKGRVLEWRVETYKSIHRWVMKFQSVIAAPSQDEEHYRHILAPTKFKIGYQGMEYASFFDAPERLFQFAMEFNQMMKKEGDFIDFSLKHELDGFQYWLDDVVMFYSAFGKAEYNKRWNFSEETIKRHCKLASKVLGIALQEDVNRFYHKIDEMLRDRLRNIKIAGVYSESWLTRCRRKLCEYCEGVMDKEDDGRYARIVEWFYYHVLFRYYGCRSQLHRNQFGLLKIFVQVHFEDQFAMNPKLLNNKTEFMKLATEYSNCFYQYLR